jgi:hypothetical protein
MPIAKLKPTVMFGYVHGPHIEPKFTIDMGDLLLRHSGTLIQGHAHRGGPDIPQNRNSLVDDLLKTDLDCLWELDTDMAYNHRILEGLLESLDPDKRPIVTALAFCRKDGELQFNWFKKQNGGFEGYQVMDSVEPKLQQIDGCGSACILIHRKALLAMREAYKDAYANHPWYGNDFILTAQGMERLSEDLTFSRRATRIGIPIWGDGRWIAGHVKPTEEGLATYKRRRAAQLAVEAGLVKKEW